MCGRDVFTLITDIAGFLPDILAPRLRTVPSHLYSPKEKTDLSRIVNLMLEFGLSFVQEKSPQGGYIYNLDPYVVITIANNARLMFYLKWHIHILF